MTHLEDPSSVSVCESASPVYHPEGVVGNWSPLTQNIVAVTIDLSHPQVRSFFISWIPPNGEKSLVATPGLGP